MKINTLLKREPFEKIFEKTIGSFFRDFTNCYHSVKWETKSNFNKVTGSAQQWYCNPLINSVFVKNVNPKVFNSINGEYSYNPLRPWRSVIQKFYLILSEYNVTAVSMSKYIIHIYPPIEDAENKLILGGNTKIRIIDIVDKMVYVILKEGFNRKYLEKEIYVRINFPFIPIPKIIINDSDKIWYCEEYITGISPNRMAVKKGQAVIIEVVEHIHKMLNETKKKVQLTEYVLSLQRKINDNIEQISCIDVKVKKDIKYLASTLTSQLYSYSVFGITVAYCHGDFHQGNILSDGEKFWILDWEYSGYKQIGYDLFILLIESRIEDGFHSRFLKMMYDELDNEKMDLIKNWPEINWNDKPLKEMYLFLFLLEELDFHVEEKSNSIFYGKPKALFARCKEIEKIVLDLTKWKNSFEY